MRKPTTLSLFLFFIVYSNLFGQTLMDGLLMEKRQLCIAGMYQKDTWNQYWEGTLLRENGNIGTFSRQAFTLMGVYGITNRLNVLTAGNYVSTAATGGQMAGVKGLQDFMFGLKAKLLNWKINEKNDLNVFASSHFSFPMTNYLSDYMPFSLGNGCPELGLRGILQYEFANKYYARLTGAYLIKTYSKVERNYYYNGQSYYSEYMDVPNAINITGAIGAWFFKNSLRVDATYSVYECLSGDDIRRQNAPQPTNKTDFNQVVLFGQYYFPKIKGLGLIANFNKTLSGRNAGKSTGFMGGVTYQINF